MIEMKVVCYESAIASLHSHRFWYWIFVAGTCWLIDGVTVLVRCRSVRDGSAVKEILEPAWWYVLGTED